MIFHIIPNHGSSPNFAFAKDRIVKNLSPNKIDCVNAFYNWSKLR